METNGLPRKEREYLQHKKEILQTALMLFSKNGFHNVTMRQIAKTSEFAVGTLYKFFPNKEDLYKQLLTEKVSDFLRMLVGALEKPGSEMEKIRSWIKEKIRIFDEHADVVRLYFAETMGVASNVRAGLKAGTKIQYDDMISKIQKIFEMGIKKSVFEKFNPYALAVALDGISNALLFECLENPEKLGKIEPDLLLDIFFNQIHLKAMPEDKQVSPLDLKSGDG